MIRVPPRLTRTDTPFPSTTFVRARATCTCGCGPSASRRGARRTRRSVATSCDPAPGSPDDRRRAPSHGVRHHDAVTEGASDDDWAPLADRFIDHYGSLRGRVRTHVIDQHLRRHMGQAPERVVDVGGGAGHQSLPLARAGHEVTIVDPSAAMLDRPAGLLAGEPDDVRARVRVVEASGEEDPASRDGATSATGAYN